MNEANNHFLRPPGSSYSLYFHLLHGTFISWCGLSPYHPTPRGWVVICPLVVLPWSLPISGPFAIGGFIMQGPRLSFKSYRNELSVHRLGFGIPTIKELFSHDSKLCSLRRLARTPECCTPTQDAPTAGRRGSGFDTGAS